MALPNLPFNYQSPPQHPPMPRSKSPETYGGGEVGSMRRMGGGRTGYEEEEEMRIQLNYKGMINVDGSQPVPGRQTFELGSTEGPFIFGRSVPEGMGESMGDASLLAERQCDIRYNKKKRRFMIRCLSLLFPTRFKLRPAQRLILQKDLTVCLGWYCGFIVESVARMGPRAVIIPEHLAPNYFPLDLTQQDSQEEEQLYAQHPILKIRFKCYPDQQKTDLDGKQIVLEGADGKLVLGRLPPPKTDLQIILSDISRVHACIKFDQEINSWVLEEVPTPDERGGVRYPTSGTYVFCRRREEWGYHQLISKERALETGMELAVGPYIYEVTNL